MKLAIAAVSGAGFQQPQSHCRGFFDEARKAVTAFSHPASHEKRQTGRVILPEIDVRDLQLQVLLLEYALWSEERELESWGIWDVSSLIEVRHQTSTPIYKTFGYPRQTLHELDITHFRPTAPSSTSWTSWIHDEELLRYLFPNPSSLLSTSF